MARIAKFVGEVEGGESTNSGVEPNEPNPGRLTLPVQHQALSPNKARNGKPCTTP